jgi:hypothetical protein
LVVSSALITFIRSHYNNHHPTTAPTTTPAPLAPPTSPPAPFNSEVDVGVVVSVEDGPDPLVVVGVVLEANVSEHGTKPLREAPVWVMAPT